MEWGQIEIHVQRQAVITAATADLQAQSPNLGIGHVDSGRAIVAFGMNAKNFQHIKHGLFHQANLFAHLQMPAPQIDQQIDDGLTGPVVGDLASAINLDERDFTGVQQMANVTCEPQCIDRLVL